MGLSRNKVAVGESAAGSPPIASSIGNRKTATLKIRGPYEPTYGLVDQMEDRRLCKAEALGSSPSESIYDALSSVMLLRKGG